MASGISPLPAWREKLLAVPEEERSYSQSVISESLKLFDEAASVICDYGSRNELDIRNPKIIKAVGNICRAVFWNSGYRNLDYCTSSETNSQVQPYVTTVVKEVLEQDYDGSEPNPEILVPMAFAAILNAELKTNRCSLEPRDDSSDEKEFFIYQCFRLNDLFAPSVKARCDEYLEKNGLSFMSPNASEILISMIKDSGMCLECSIWFTLSCVREELGRYQSMIRRLQRKAQFILTACEDGHDAALGTVRAHFGILDYTYRRMGHFHMYLVKNCPDPVNQCDPHSKGWWKAAETYLKLLRHGLKKAEQEAPDDLYFIAILNRCLLTAMLSGVAKYVTYAEIESICNEMKSAAEACSAWAPPLWKLEIENHCKIVVEKVLPFLCKINPSTYETASVDVSTPGFLDIYTPIDVQNWLYGNRLKKCDACGIDSINLLKCKVCESAWYCDKKCQKNDWRRHKVVCKEMQRANGAAA